MKGSLLLTIEEAKLTHDTEMFSNMDPYCKVYFNGKKFKTNTKHEGGKTPKWRYKFEIYFNNLNEEIEFKVLDEDMITDDVVGSVKCKIADILGATDFEHVKWLRLTYDHGKPAGDLCIKTQFTWPKGYHHSNQDAAIQAA